MCPTMNTTVKRITPMTDPPKMLPIWLKTWAMTPLQGQSQQAGIGQHVREPAGDAVEVIGAEGQAEERILLVPGGHEKDACRTGDGHDLAERVQKRREIEFHLGDAVEHLRRQQHEDQADQQQEPAHHVEEEAREIPVLQTGVAFEGQAGEEMDQAEEQRIDQHLRGILQRCEPQGPEGNLMAEEGPGHHVDGVPEDAPPNMRPQKMVEMPHQKKSWRLRFIFSPIRGNFSSAKPQATEVMRP